VDIIEEPVATLGSEFTNDPIRALVPFFARIAQDRAQLFKPPSFEEAEYSSPHGLRWAATAVVVRNNQGAYKLYLCERRGLAM
jgi:hypothetical protein